MTSQEPLPTISRELVRDLVQAEQREVGRAPAGTDAMAISLEPPIQVSFGGKNPGPARVEARGRTAFAIGKSFKFASASRALGDDQRLVARPPAEARRLKLT